MTQRKVTFVLAVVAGLLGIAHLALTALIYASWTADSLWFVGTGLAIVIGAAANIAAINALDRISRTIVVIINVIMMGFFVAALSVLPGPQVIVGCILFAGLAACSWRTTIPSISSIVEQ
jgi:hypothetical protein